MELVLVLVALAAMGAIVTAAARLALPGPDPMPVWLMSLIGAVAIVVGGGIGYAVGEATGALLGAVVFATLVLIGYRRLVQRRGITGPGAQHLPTRGIGVRRLRRRWGIEAAPTAETSALVLKLAELRDNGLLTADEYELLRRRLGAPS